MRFVTRRADLLLAALYLGAALHGLGAADIVGDDEAREAGIVQAIVAGEWLHPRFNGELIPDKPLLYHWLAAVPCALAGFSETAVRLPSALAGAALIAWTARFGADLLGPQAGLVAAGLLATTPTLLHHARVARPDVLLVFLLSLALGFAYRWWRDGRRRDAGLALATLGAATLAKGPVAPALFAFTLGTFLAWQGELRRVRELLTLPGLIVFLVLGLGWYAIALAGWGEEFVRAHLVGRYARNLFGGLPAGGAYSRHAFGYHLLFYPKHLPATVLPWTPLIALGLWQATRGGGLSDPRLRFLLCWALAPIVVFTPAEWKLRYYLLPSLPALALITAPAAITLWRRPSRRVDRWAVLLLGLPIAALLVGALWAVTAGRLPLSTADRSLFDVLLALVPGRATTLVAAAATLAAALLVAALTSWRMLLGSVAAGAIVWSLIGTPALEQAVSRRDSLRPFAEAAVRRFPDPGGLVFYRATIRPVVVYVGRRVPTVEHAEDTAPGAGLIARGGAYRALAAAGKLGAPLVSGEGRVGNVARGKVVLAERAAKPYAVTPRGDFGAVPTTARRRRTIDSSSSTVSRLISSTLFRCDGVRAATRSSRTSSL